MSCETQAAKVFPQEDKVVLILDPPIMIEINFIEQMFILTAISLGSNILKTFIESDLKLIQVHQSLFSSGIGSFPMKPLNGQLSKVLFNREVDLNILIKVTNSS